MIFQYMFYSLEGGLPSSMKPNVPSALLGDIGCSKIIGNILFEGYRRLSKLQARIRLYCTDGQCHNFLV